MKTKQEIWYAACKRQIETYKEVMRFIRLKERKKHGGPKVPYVMQNLQHAKNRLSRNIVKLAELLYGKISL